MHVRVSHWLEHVKKKSSMVELVVSAPALTIFSRIQKHPPALREAVLRYGRLLRITREQIIIMSSDKKVRDDHLMTIVLMACYETAMHQSENIKPAHLLNSEHSWSHHDGALAILKSWSRWRGNEPPSNIVKQVRRGLLRSSLLRNYSLPDWINDGTRFGEEGIDLAFDSIIVRVVNLRAAFKTLGQNKCIAVVGVKDLVNEARDLDDMCGQWVEKLPPEWIY